MRFKGYSSFIAPIAALITISGVGLSSRFAAAQTVYVGNGNTGFGGEVGGGSLTVSNGTDATTGNPNVTFSFLESSSHPSLDGNDLVVYLSTGAAGLSDTSTLKDNGDGGREAVSGYNGSSTPPTQTQVNFATGFQATYAISIQDEFVGLFHLINLTSPPSLDYVGANATPSTGVTESSGGGATPDTVTIPLSVIGVTPGQTLQFVGTLISTSAFRSNESFGASDVTPNSSPGFTGTQTFTSSDVFMTPEPSSIAFLGFGAIALSRRRRTANAV